VVQRDTGAAEQPARLSNVLIIMIGAFTALLMMAASASALLALGPRLRAPSASGDPSELLVPVLAVLGLIMGPGLVQGLFVGYLAPGREEHLAIHSSFVSGVLATVGACAMMRGVQFGGAAGDMAIRLAMAGMAALFAALFIVAAGLGAHWAALERRKLQARREKRGD
jgi:hypothetical protein